MTAGGDTGGAHGTAPRRLSVHESSRQLTAPGQLFEVDEIEIRGIATRIWKHAPPTGLDVVKLSQGHGTKDFLVYEDEHLTFEQHFRSAATVARRLREDFGVENGDRVAIAMRNLPEWVVSFWGALLAGAVAVPLNAWWNADELRYGLVDSGSKAVVCDLQRAEMLVPLMPDLPELRGLVWVDEARRDRRPETAPPAGASVLPWPEWLGAVAPDAAPPQVDVQPEDDATIFYTSGTTGRPKGAVGTHRNLCTNLMTLGFLNARSSLMNAQRERPAEGDGPAQQAYLLSVPLFHVTGCLAIMVGNTAAGGKIVMMHHFQPERALELIERERITVFGGVPSMVMQVLDSPDFGRRDTSSVRGVSYGGAPAPPELVRRITEHFPAGNPSNGYGLTETSSVATMNSGPDYVRKPDSVGPPVPVCDVAVVPEDYEGEEPAPELPSGPEVSGELWIKGPNVVRGYWNRPEDTARVITRGWLHTGDVARIDEEGFVHIVDRAKDVIIRGGENVYSVEVEDALYEHPAVAECAVIGIPHPVLGEEVGVIVVPRPGAESDEEELARHVAARVARYAVPAHFWFRKEPLPRNPAGKVLKRALRSELLSDGS